MEAQLPDYPYNYFKIPILPLLLSLLLSLSPLHLSRCLFSLATFSLSFFPIPATLIKGSGDSDKFIALKVSGDVKVGDFCFYC
jgi:hypothetical protein